MKMTLKAQQGFTLVEIMIVVAIIGLLASIGIPSFMKARQKSLENTKNANIRQIEAAISRFAFDTSRTNGASVAWSEILPYLKETDQDHYTVGNDPLDASTFTVGGDVEYTE